MSGYASINRNLPTGLTSHIGPVNAEAVVVGDGGNVGDVSFGRYTTIIKPAAIPTSAPVSHQAFVYTVSQGETLAVIAARYNVTVSDLRWSNSNLFSNTTVSTGDRIVVPPVPGVVIVTKSSDTLAVIASKYNVDPQVIIDFNRLRTSQLTPGTVLVVPGGVGGNFPPPPSIYQLLTRATVGTGFPAHVVNCCLGPYNASAFPAGWCTYYVATKRNVTWRGDAGWWYANAAAQGYPEGQKPKVGAIMVTWESWAGHVAYVEAVNPDGSWVVSEMNWLAFDVIDERTIKPGQLGGKLEGFIYG